MKILINIILLSLLLSGCKKYESFSPPEDSENVSISVKLPPDIELPPVGVMYRSSICPQERTKGNGEHYELPGFHFTKFTLKKNGESNLYSFTVPVDGGGECHWQLSNVTIKMQFIKEIFGEDITKNIGARVVFIFDNNPPLADNGIYEEVQGDLNITKDYFPWIMEQFLSEHSTDFWMSGCLDVWMYGGELLVNYKTKSTKKILFIPKSHSEYIVRSLDEKRKSKGNHTQFTYPDGEIVADGSVFPDYNKLMGLVNKK